MGDYPKSWRKIPLWQPTKMEIYCGNFRLCQHPTTWSSSGGSQFTDAKLILRSHENFPEKTKEILKRSCNRFINYRQHDRAFLVPDFLTKLPVKPPYMAMGSCTAKFVYITAMQFHTSWVCVKEGWIFKKARHSIFESFDNGAETIKMSFFPRIRMLLPTVHRIR